MKKKKLLQRSWFAET